MGPGRAPCSVRPGRNARGSGRPLRRRRIRPGEASRGQRLWLPLEVRLLDLTSGPVCFDWMVPSERSQQAVWAFLSETERLARYYQAMTQRYDRFNATLTWFLVFAGLASTVLLAFDVHRGWQLSVVVALAGMAVLNAASRFGEKAASLKIIGERSRALNTQAHRLWRQTSSLGAEGAEQALQQLEERLHAEVSASAISSGLPINSELEKWATKTAAASLKARYSATQTPRGGNPPGV